MSAKQKTEFFGWTNVAVLFLCYFLVNGMMFYGFSVLFPAMIKAMHWARGDASVAHTIRALFIGVTAPLIAIAVNRMGIKKTILSGGAFAVAGLVLLGTATDKLWQWTLFWGFICGIGMAGTGLVPIQTSLAFWFNKNRGLTMGLVTVGMSLAGIVTQPFFTWVINATGSWQMGWLAGAGIAFIGLIGILWLKSKPSEYGQYQDGISPEQAEAYAAAGRKIIRTYRTSKPWVLKQAIKTPVLWYMILMFSMVMVVIYFIVSHGVLHFTDLKYTRMQAAYALSAFALGSGITRVLMGWLSDFVEPRWILLGLFTGLVGGLIGIWQVPSLTLLVFSSFISGFCCSAVLVVVPTMAANYYGAEDFAAINSFMLPFQIGSSALIPLIAGYVHDVQKSYDAVFIGMLVLCGASILSALLSSPPAQKETVAEINTTLEKEHYGTTTV